MSTQDRMFDAPADADPAMTPRRKGIIRRSDLRDSYRDSHAVEDAWWRRLYDHGIDEHSSPAKVCTALALELGAPPSGIEQEAWERIAQSYREWVTIFGNLQLFWQLRRKRDE
jgi:hypothetical protein